MNEGNIMHDEFVSFISKQINTNIDDTVNKFFGPWTGRELLFNMHYINPPGKGRNNHIKFKKIFDSFPVDNLTFEVEDTNLIYKYETDTSIYNPSAPIKKYEDMFFISVSAMTDPHSKYYKLLKLEHNNCKFLDPGLLNTGACMYIYQTTELYKK